MTRVMFERRWNSQASCFSTSDKQIVRLYEAHQASDKRICRDAHHIEQADGMECVKSSRLIFPRNPGVDEATIVKGERPAHVRMYEYGKVINVCLPYGSNAAVLLEPFCKSCIPDPIE